MPKGIQQKTGNAPVKRMGHTTNGAGGSEYNAKRVGNANVVQELKVGRNGN